MSRKKAQTHSPPFELFSQNGLPVQTHTAYPTTIYNKVTLSGVNATMKVRPLKNIWK
jgi:hypothetical protein